MASFTFFKIRGGSKVSSFEIEDFDTMEQAKLHAAALLDQASCDAVEICFGEDCVLVKRGEPA